ncbi:MAG TPA: hypothetical protein DCX06_12855 [Opitutae bacterium]|nr:hypothetical protein [Opitutae bacterium]
MKTLTLLFTLAAGIALATPAVTNAQEEQQLSIWERIFGTSERPSKEAAQSEPEKSTDEDEQGENAKKKEKPQSATFSEEERAVLENWQNREASEKKAKKKKSLPPGLQKKVARGGELPPGWRKKLEVGAVLDPELEKEAQSLPQKVLESLPTTPEGTEIIQIADQVIRVFENSREIIDIISGQPDSTTD